MSSPLLGLATGLAFGALMSSGKVCFNAGVRRAAFERQPTVLRVFAIVVMVELLALPGLLAFDVSPLDANVDAGAPALLPVAQLVGGLVFGTGMALAGGCISGILWKAGAGSIATALAIGGFAGGELLAQGAGEGLLADLDRASRPADSSLPELLGVSYELLAPLLGAIGLWLLARRTRDGLGLGVAIGIVAALAWVAADLADYGYGLGFAGAAEGTREAVESGGELPFALWLAIGVLAGGALIVRGPLRRPDAARGARAIAGGILMGVGASAAHACNIGHGVTGAGLLSLGSLLAVAAMAAGALATMRFVLRPLPALRGNERPEAVGW
jgi:uncharacterized membrane protein YedE/YeeE